MNTVNRLNSYTSMKSAICFLLIMQNVCRNLASEMCGFPSEFTEPDGWWALDIDDPRFVGPFVYQFQPEGLMSFFGENGDTPNAALSHDCTTGGHQEGSRYFVVQESEQLNIGKYCNMYQSIDNIVVHAVASVDSTFSDPTNCPSEVLAADPIHFDAFISSPFDATIDSPFDAGIYYTTISLPDGSETLCVDDKSSIANFRESSIEVLSCDETATYLMPYSATFNITAKFSASDIDLDSSDGDFLILLGPDDAYYFARYKLSSDEQVIDLTLDVPDRFRQCVWHSTRPAGQATSQSIQAANGDTRVFQYINFQFTRESAQSVGFTMSGDLDNVTDAQQQDMADQLKDEIVNATGVDPDRLNIEFAPGSIIVRITVQPGLPGEPTTAEVIEAILNMYADFVLVDADGNVIGEAIDGSFVHHTEVEGTTMMSTQESDDEETTMVSTSEPGNEMSVTTPATETMVEGTTMVSTQESDDEETTMVSTSEPGNEMSVTTPATETMVLEDTSDSPITADVPDTTTAADDIRDLGSTEAPNRLEGGEHVDLRFEESYNSIVKPDVEAFNTAMEEQLEEIAELPDDSGRLVVDSAPGSIMVGIDISPGDPTAKVVADRIRAAYNNRMLTLVGPDGTVLQTDYDFFQQYTLIGECTDKPCENHGVCTALNDDNYHCDCLSGFSGSNCDEEDLVTLTIILIIVLTTAVVIILLVCVCVCACQCNRPEPTKHWQDEQDDYVSIVKHPTAWRSAYLDI